MFGAEIRHRGRHNDNVRAAREAFHLVPHLPGRLHTHHGRPGGNIGFGMAGHHKNRRPPLHRDVRNGQPLPAGGMIADISHRVDGFPGAAGRDQQGLPHQGGLEGFPIVDGAGQLNNVVGF